MPDSETQVTAPVRPALFLRLMLDLPHRRQARPDNGARRHKRGHDQGKRDKRTLSEKQGQPQPVIWGLSPQPQNPPHRKGHQHIERRPDRREDPIRRIEARQCRCVRLLMMEAAATGITATAALVGVVLVVWAW
jgi:hypothetical protein